MKTVAINLSWAGAVAVSSCLMVASLLGVASSARATENEDFSRGLVVPEVRPPAEILEEGTETRLSVRQIEEILPWAVTSRSTLENLLDMSNGDSTSESIRILEDGIEPVLRGGPLQ